MLSAVVRNILDCQNSGLTASGRKNVKKYLASKLLLCRRLLLAGAGAGGFPLEKSTLLWLAVAYMNANLEALEVSDGAGVPCPGWKGHFVEGLISILRLHGAMDSFLSGSVDATAIPYDLGQYTYPALQVASKSERRKALLDIIKSRFATRWETSSDNTGFVFLESSTWAELLMFTSSDTPQAATALDAKRKEWKNSQAQELQKDVVSPPKLKNAEPRGLVAAPSGLSVAEEAFKSFARNEKLRLRAAMEAKRANSRHEKNIRLNDLKKFSESFKLKTPVPEDLVALLAKDPERQLEISRKAKLSAEKSVRSNDGRQEQEQGSEQVNLQPLAKVTSYAGMLKRVSNANQIQT